MQVASSSSQEAAQTTPAGSDTLIEQAPELAKTLVVDYGPKVLTAMVVLFVGWWVAGLLTRVFGRMLQARNVEGTLIGFLKSICNALLMTLVVVSALGTLGIQTTSLAAVIGAAGLAVGLALQGTLSNFASGVILILFKPFKAGDLVDVAGQVGIVEDVQIFVTTVLSLDNKKVIIPNGSITSGNVVNFSGMDTRRVDMVFGISYGDDLKVAKRVMEEVLAKNAFALQDPAPRVAVKELGDSSVNFVVRPWCKTADYWDCWFSVTEEVKLALDASGITIPFPQRDVHMHSVA